MGIKCCLVVWGEVNTQVCTINHQCAKSRREVSFSVWLWACLGVISKNGLQLVQRCFLVIGGVGSNLTQMCENPNYVPNAQI
jgi:hypothetical protein